MIAFGKLWLASPCLFLRKVYHGRGKRASFWMQNTSPWRSKFYGSPNKLLFVFLLVICYTKKENFAKISKIISFAPCENETTKISNIIIPIKTWLEQDGSFVNAMGESQNFTKIIESDVLSEIEVIEKLNG